MVEVGDTLSYERVFTKQEVRQFTELSQDKGAHHLIEDEQGRLVVHGLLTATLPTKLGGDFNLLATQMSFNFMRQVYTGDNIQCVSVIEQVDRVKEGRLDIRGTFECRNQEGVKVLKGQFSGVIFD